MTIEIDIAHWRQDLPYCQQIIDRTGLTRQELGDLLGLSRVQIGNYYNNRAVMPYPVQVCIAILAAQNTDEYGNQIKFARTAGALPGEQRRKPKSTIA